MDKDTKSIHEIDLNIICDYYSLMERQGPGSTEMTLKALSFIDYLNEKSKIADLGCGTGNQTMTLGKHTKAQITGIDIFPKFINLFNENAEKENLDDKVKGIVGSMDDLTYKNDELDVIWSEGAIYNIGFEKGANYWHKFIKKGGYIAVTEACWFKNERPKEIEDFWNEIYPEIDTIANKVSQLQKANYIPIATFVLPEKCWIDNFYKLHEPARKEFLKQYKGNKQAEEFIAFEKYETELYHKYKEYYGYVFFIGKKL